MKSKNNLVIFKRLLTVLFLIALVGLVFLNISSTMQLDELDQKQVQLQLELKYEQNLDRQLQSLKGSFRKLQYELKMMEYGLQKLYCDNSIQLDNFIPAFDDQVVVYLPNRKNDPYVSSIFLGAAESRSRSKKYELIFGVPRTGDHRLKIVAGQRSSSASVSLHGGDIAFSGSYPLDAGSSYQVAFRFANDKRKVQMILEGPNRTEIELPFDLANRAHFSESARITERLASNSNQIAGFDLSDPTRDPFAQVQIRDNLFRGVNRTFLVQLFIESDGPMTASPVDPFVVGMLLHNINAGKKPTFKFNPKGWYEFEGPEL